MGPYQTSNIMNQWYIKGFALVLLGLAVYLVLYLTDLDPGNLHRFRHIFVNYSNLNQSVDREAEIQYRQLFWKYNTNLFSIPKQQYLPSERFKQIGLPLSSVWKENTSDSLKSRNKRILAWTPFFANPNWIPNVTCSGDKTCVATSNRNDLAIADGIVVHPRDLSSRNDLPTTMLPHQRLIYFIQESPWATGINVGDFNGVFNWTVTYRMDSDVPSPYIQSQLLPEPLSEGKYEELFEKIMRSKTKTIAYMNSNCQAPHTKRLEFIKDLRRYINVDFYGACGDLNCPRQSDACTQKMLQYKFYLSLENAHCRDYITEKISEPLNVWNAVPVVMGGGDPSEYERILPPNSFIHTSGFKSTRELADYLILMDNNPKLYEEYHQWRKTYKTDSPNLWCNICLALHNSSLPLQAYSDFKGWYREDVCLP